MLMMIIPFLWIFFFQPYEPAGKSPPENDCYYQLLDEILWEAECNKKRTNCYGNGPSLVSEKNIDVSHLSLRFSNLQVMSARGNPLNRSTS